MRNIIFLLFVLISSLSIAQTKLDSLIFIKINKYRNDNGLCSLMWDNSLFKVADNQSEYMVLTNHVSHIQEIPYDTNILNSFIVEPIVSKRFEKFQSDSLTRIIGENIISVIIDDNLTLDNLSDTIINSWKMSPPHNELLLKDNICEGAISNRYKENVLDFIDHGISIIPTFSNKIYVSFETHSDPIN